MGIRVIAEEAKKVSGQSGAWSLVIISFKTDPGGYFFSIIPGSKRGKKTTVEEEEVLMPGGSSKHEIIIVAVLNHYWLLSQECQLLEAVEATQVRWSLAQDQR